MKNALSILTFTLLVLSSCKDEPLDPNTFIVEKPGYLVTMINEVDRNLITEMKIKGNIDARDIKFLNSEIPNLSILDLSEVTIKSFTGTGGTINSSQTYNENELPFLAFSELSSLNSVVLPKNLTSIAGRSFYRCINLVNITIPSTVTSISGDYTFNGCHNLRIIEIPNSVTSLGNGTFGLCSNLEIVTLGNSITTIGSSSFLQCYKLKQIIIPDEVQTISELAFYKCSYLENITLGKSLNSIGSGAFHYCTKLKKITFNSSTPPMASSNTGTEVNFSTCILDIPKGSRLRYISATYWKNFTNIIEREN